MTAARGMTWTATKEACEARAIELSTRLPPGAPDQSQPDMAAAQAVFEELSQVPASFTTDALVEALRGATVAFHFGGREPRVACLLAERHLFYARQLASWHAVRRALSMLGALQIDTGDFARAADNCVDALLLSREHSDNPGESAALTNASLLFMAKLDHEASRNCALRAAQVLVGDPEHLPSQLLAIGNASGAALRLGQLEETIRIVDNGLAAASGVEDPGALRPQQILRVNGARALMMLGRRTQAIEYAKGALVSTGAQSHHRAVFVSLMAEAIISGLEDEPESGLEKLVELVGRARTLGVSTHTDALAFAAELLEACDKPERACYYLRELDDIRRSQQAVRWSAVLREFAPDNAAAEAQLVRLETGLTSLIQRKESALIELAIDGALAAHHSPRRPYRVAKLAELFACSLKLPEGDVQSIREAAFLVDIGMVAASETTLRKGRSLTRAERLRLMEHTGHGARLVMDMGLEKHRAVVDFIRLHHERWDGSGPFGLAGEDLPLGVRIIGMVDALDAMCSERPWRQAMTLPEAVATLEASAGTLFEPQLAQQFVGFVRAEYWRHRSFWEMLEEAARDSAYIRARDILAQAVI